MTGVGNIWDQVLSRIEGKVNHHSFTTWFRPTSYLKDDGATITVRVPNALFRDWLTKHYSAVIDEALSESDRSGATIAFVMQDDPSFVDGQPSAPSVAAPPAIGGEEQPGQP